MCGEGVWEKGEGERDRKEDKVKSIVGDEEEREKIQNITLYLPNGMGKGVKVRYYVFIALYL